MLKVDDFIKYQVACQNELVRIQKDICRDSLEAFARIYLPQHFSCEPSVMHREIFGLLEEATNTRNRRLAVAAPRGHAKTTLASLAYVLWSICYNQEPYIVLISNTAEQSAEAASTWRHYY